MFEKGFILTKEFPHKSIIHNKHSRRNKHLLNETEFHWKILKREKPEESDELESYMYPTKDIGFGLNNQSIIEQLNSHKIFDFEYKPEEYDNLQIFEKTPLSSYLSFVFQNGEWKSEFPYFHFENSLKFKGYVKAYL
ncbi:MAG TPA: hypothetical protein PK431_07820 [Chitinophagales bacterium]|nr:hypothetical protein [Chitinophagales bacterium]